MIRDWIVRLTERLRRPARDTRRLYACETCGDETNTWSMTVDRETLRRRRIYLCDDCKFNANRPDDSAARRERVERDWDDMTIPVADDAYEERMGEQYPSRVREVLRAFSLADTDGATVTDVAASTLQSAIEGLGLDGVMYAETRGTETVLRRVAVRA